ncbi:MAG: hypothetical protein AAGG50_19775 [Bacteroidota bacterium]
MRLLLAYNADGGLANAAFHTAHRLLSPSTYACPLCALTHGPLAMRRRWRATLDGLGVPVVFLHRDEIAEVHPSLAGLSLPAILTDRGPDDLHPTVLLRADAIEACADLNALIAALETALAERASERGL